MKGYTVKMLFRSIKDSLGRYLAILSIVALGVGLYSGLNVSEPAMRASASDYIDETGMYDFRFLSSLGFSDENVESVRGSGKVSAAEGAFFSEALAETGTDTLPVMFMSLTSEVAVPVLSAGRMPENAGECLADKALFSEEDIGKTVRVGIGNEEDVLDLFSETEFVITGLAGSPRYISFERGATSLGSGKLEGFIIVPPEAFDGDIYHELLVDCGLDDAFTAEYEDAADAIKPEMETLLKSVGSDRYDVLRAEADEELADARRELDDGWAEYEDGKAEAERELADGRKEIEEARDELDSATYQLYKNRSQIKEGYAELDEGEKELEKNQALLDAEAAKLEAGEPALKEAEAKVAAARSEFEASKAETLSGIDAQRQQYSSQLSQLEAAIQLLEQQGTAEAQAKLQDLYPQREQLNAALEQIDAARALAESQFAAAEQELIAGENEVASQRVAFEAGKAALEKGQAELEAGRAEIKANRKKLDDGMIRVSNGLEEVTKGYRELEDAEKELEKAEADAAEELADALAELEDGEREYADAVKDVDEELKLDVYCLDRGSNAGCSTFTNDIAIVSAAAKALPVFFVLIASLVCVTTMTRMVNEERTQIGTLKALGFSSLDASSKYLLYAGSAAFLGCAAGLAAGMTVIPYVVWYAYTIIYNYSALKFYFDPSLAALSAAVAVPGIIAVTALACRNEMNEKPAELIRPKAPSTGKRIFLERIRVLWKRFGFLTKVMLRNAFRKPARVLMMIVGIGGCTALMIAGFGVEDTIAGVMDYQYGEIFHYDLTVYYDPETYPTADEASELWSDYAEHSAVIWQGEAELTAPGGESRSVFLRCANEDMYAGMVSFKTEDGAPAVYPGPGEVLLTAGVADALDLSAGDTVTLTGNDFPDARLTVCSVAENYVQKYVYVCPESIGSPAANTGLAAAGANASEAAAKIRAEEGISYVSCADDEKSVMDKSMSSLSLIIIMVVVCSAALAFITVFNLTNINIMERVREIATVKVLGFRQKETASYVLRENLLLSFLGALAGLPLGKLLHRFLMELIKVEYLRYDIRVLPRSYALGFAATVLFVLLINLLMRSKLDAVNMAESLKSVE